MKKKITISIVDDNPLFACAISHFLNSIDEFEVHATASSGAEYLEICESLVSDVVFIDYEMPQMDGSELIRKLRHRAKISSKLLGLSSHTEIRNVYQMLKAGADGFVPKETKINDLVNSVHRVLEYSFYMSPLLSKHFYFRGPNLGFDFIDPLSPIEVDIIRLVCEQKNSTEIARDLGLSKNTINSYRTKILEKTGVKNTAGLVIYAIDTGICVKSVQR